jgi:hypothetical protein
MYQHTGVLWSALLYYFFYSIGFKAHALSSLVFVIPGQEPFRELSLGRKALMLVVESPLKTPLPWLPRFYLRLESLPE